MNTNESSEPTGVAVDIGDVRRVVAFPYSDGNVSFRFYNGEVETRIRLSPEAVNAMAAICLELRTRPSTAELREDVAVDIGDVRRVVAFPYSDGNVSFRFYNGEVETRIRLSPEAVNAMAAICLELRTRPSTAELREEAALWEERARHLGWRDEHEPDVQANPDHGGR
jgi:hypothetical protein